MRIYPLPECVSQLHEPVVSIQRAEVLVNAKTPFSYKSSIKAVNDASIACPIFKLYNYGSTLI